MQVCAALSQVDERLREAMAVHKQSEQSLVQDLDALR